MSLVIDVSSLRLPVRFMEGCAVVSLPWEIDFGNADQVSATLLAVLNPRVAGVVADMSATRYSDAAGIRAVVRASSRAEERGGWVRVVIPRPGVRSAFMLAGADSVVQIYASLGEALPGCWEATPAQADQPVPIALLVPGQPSYPELVPPWEASKSAALPAAEPSARAAMFLPPQRSGSPETFAALAGRSDRQPKPAHGLARSERTLSLITDSRSACDRSRAARSQAKVLLERLAVTFADIAAICDQMARRSPDKAARLLPISQAVRDQAMTCRLLATGDAA